MGVLVCGTAGGQFLAILAAPILTRLYSPEDFGLLAVYASLLSLIGVLASLRYELAIPLPESDEEAAHVAVLSLLIVCGMTALAAIVMAIFGSSIANALGVPVLTDYLWLLPVGVLLGGVYNVFNYWAVRTKSFTTIAGTKIRQAVVSLLIQLTAFKLGGIALLFAQVAGQSVGTWSLARLAIRKKAFESVTWGQIHSVAIRYKRFPIFSTWEGLGNTAGLMLPPILFASFFGAAAAGLYSLANRVLQLPMSLVGSAIGQVFFAEAAEANRKGKVGQLVAGLHSKLAHIGMAPALLLILIGPDLFSVVFGEQWRTAGEFARWMAPWIYLVFVSSPLSTLFAVMEKQVQGLFFQIVLLVSRIVAIFSGAALGGLIETVILFSVASALCWLGFLFWLGRLVGLSALSMIYPALRALGVSVICLLPIILAIGVDYGVGLFWLIALLASIALVIAQYWLMLRKVFQ